MPIYMIRYACVVLSRVKRLNYDSAQLEHDFPFSDGLIKRYSQHHHFVVLVFRRSRSVNVRRYL